VAFALFMMIYSSTPTTIVYASTSSGNGGSGSSTSSGGSSSSSPSASTSSGSSASGSSTPSSSANSGSPGSSSGSSDGSSGSSGGGGTAHCDMPGYPSCSSLGTHAAQNAAPGSSCPPGHSTEFCNAYNAATGSSTDQPGSSPQQARSADMNTTSSSASSNTTGLSSRHADAAHCDQKGYPSCYSIGFQDGKGYLGSKCPSRHSVNFCAGWNAAAGNPTTTTIQKIAKVTELAPGAAPGPHTSEYIQAFNIAAGNPYKPGTKQYDDYQAGLNDATKAGRDCDKMDTCGGPDLLGTYVKGVLYLESKQYCGNGFGVYSNTLCSFQKGCTANIIGVVACPSAPKPVGSGGGGGGSTTTIVRYIGGIPGLGIVQAPNVDSDSIIMLPSNASDFANNDPKTLTLDFVNPTGPDSIGNYYIKGEVVNNGIATIQNLKITAHWYDSTHKLIGVTFGYPDSVLQPLNSGKRTTFTILADGPTDLIGKPKFVELSYDWQ
jgi:hypothetical protein